MYMSSEGDCRVLNSGKWYHKRLALTLKVAQYMPYNIKMVKSKMSDTDKKRINTRRKAKAPESIKSLAKALKDNLKRRKAASSAALKKIDQ